MSPSSLRLATTVWSTERYFTVSAATGADVADELASTSYRFRRSGYESGIVTAPEIAVSVTDAGDEVTALR